MNYKIVTLPHVSFIQVLKTVKYGSAALHETLVLFPILEDRWVHLYLPKWLRKQMWRFRRQLEPWMEVNVVLTSGTALPYAPKLLSKPVNMVQLHSITRRSIGIGCIPTPTLTLQLLSNGCFSLLLVAVVSSDTRLSPSVSIDNSPDKFHVAITITASKELNTNFSCCLIFVSVLEWRKQNNTKI